MRLVLAISGSSGAIYGVRLVQELARAGVEVHLILSAWAEKTISVETPFTPEQVRSWAAQCYPYADVSSRPASGSFRSDGMAIVPCSMRTLAAVAHGLADNLVARAADVHLKEGRKLVLAPRETPLSAIHLENMLKLARLGVAIMPPVPAFYGHPKTIEDLVDHFVGRVLDRFGLEHELYRPYGGLESEK